MVWGRRPRGSHGPFQLPSASFRRTLPAVGVKERGIFKCSTQGREVSRNHRSARQLVRQNRVYWMATLAFLGGWLLDNRGEAYSGQIGY